MANTIIINVIECDIIASRFTNKTRRAAYFHRAEAERMLLRNDLREMSDAYDAAIGDTRAALLTAMLSAENFKRQVLIVRAKFHKDQSTRLAQYAYKIQVLLGDVGNMKSDQIATKVRLLHEEGITRDV